MTGDKTELLVELLRRADSDLERRAILLWAATPGMTVQQANDAVGFVPRPRTTWGY